MPKDEKGDPSEDRDYFLEFLQVSMGIAPDSLVRFDRDTHPRTVDDWLEMLPEDEARKARRKFRKLWRKQAKQLGWPMKSRSVRRAFVRLEAQKKSSMGLEE